MPNKIFHVFHLAKLQLQSIDLSHYVAKLRQFAHNYSLPLIATAFLLVLVAVGTYVRNSEHIAIATISDSLDSKGVSYGGLLSNDKTSNLTVETGSDAKPTSTDSSAGTPSSFSVNTNSAIGNKSSSGGAGSPPFAATIAFFDQGGVTLQCTKSNPKPQWCTKQYAFSSGVRTQNGPGTVNYGWRSTIASAVADGSISAGSGDALTSLQKTISLPCTTPTSFTLQFIIVSPRSTQSGIKTINHNCNEL